MDSNETLDSEDSQINLLILGSGGFAQAMESEIRVRKGVEEKIKSCDDLEVNYAGLLG